MEKESTCGGMELHMRCSKCSCYHCVAMTLLTGYTQGDFSDGCITGTGSYFWPDGRYTTGDIVFYELRAFIIHVYTYTYTCTIWYSWYRGEVLRGLRHGEGVFQGSDGVTCYTGQWHMGKRHGKVACALHWSPIMA